MWVNKGNIFCNLLEPVLIGHPALSVYLRGSQGCPLYEGFTVNCSLGKQMKCRSWYFYKKLN